MTVSRTRRWAACGLLVAAAGAVAGSASAAPPVATTGSTEELAGMLARSAPNADRHVLTLAATALRCALRRPELGISGERLGVIDYSRPSTDQRLWVFDLARQKLLFEEWVAHGRNSGGNRTEHFSNRDGSFMSSLGVFSAQETYMGGNGYSLRLDGLEPGYNDHARDRAIVIHGAPYVNPTMARLQGRLGRSLGCPAVRLSVSRPLIDSLRGGAMVFAYYPDAAWLQHSPLLDADCGAAKGVAPR
ncbi:MAG: hypothetical protein GAK43_00078 [Stenotrophomonas maltophilia]|nr:MAG: hypothetical protein GAK43_00078 [Stenotrophomonas maltophilia]